ncbi:MAG: Helix-turn-helix domain protein [Candidatus Atribacteria bacterium ADurb.Bin276]|uniref:Helix-turn-helix domain protein n=1 Tax=Candidatus Atribacter allofermentans TaxID=1852833 RepID=A0A1V5T4N6_9BACT|nr:MAG: Helix-turn-helix domain protein [Candidatus Atribacteria bacterium ADurb.Bin276]
MKKILDEEYYSLIETSELLGISRQAVHTLIKNGKLKGRKIGRLWHFSRKDIKEYLDQRTPPPGTKKED